MFRRGLITVLFCLALSLVICNFAYAENPALSTGLSETPSTPFQVETERVAGTLATGNANTPGWCGGPYIDLTAGPADLLIVRFEMYFKGTVNRDVEVYWKAGSYVGSEGIPGDWTLLGSVNVTPGGDGTLTPVEIGGVVIPAGQTYGFKVWDGGTGSADGPGLDLRDGGTIASDANLSLNSQNYTCYLPFDINDLATGFGWQGSVEYGDVPVELMSFVIE